MFWDLPLAGKEGPRGKDFNMRWIASMVADVHRILTRGGIFMYPCYQEKQEILKEIEEHIRREETDIVHDILAYLAEQMIEINREKQKEIKSFLRYLERIIGSAIDNLTNKSKIQNYLGDYQKSEPHLSCDQLWEILKKNKKKITVNLLDRQIQETLEKEYQTSLEKLLV